MLHQAVITSVFCVEHTYDLNPTVLQPGASPLLDPIPVLPRFFLVPIPRFRVGRTIELQREKEFSVANAVDFKPQIQNTLNSDAAPLE
jgi:hypothetical protein